MAGIRIDNSDEKSRRTNKLWEQFNLYAQQKQQNDNASTKVPPNSVFTISAGAGLVP